MTDGSDPISEERFQVQSGPQGLKPRLLFALLRHD